MTNDIVARIRLYANASIDGGWANVFRSDLNIAADEIERLREALRIEQEEFAACCIDRKETQRERDEARRSVCKMSIQLGGVFRRVGGKTVEVTTPEGCAEIMRWDCFRVDPHCKYCQTHDDLMRESDDGMCVTCQRERFDDGP
jgi:hypothetical protein